MKKEVLLAIVSGLVLGLIITMGIYTANRSLNQQKAKKQLQTTPAPAVTNGLNQKSLNLTAPENYDLVSEPDLTLSGVAWPKAVVALISEADSQLLQADNEGIFIFNTRLIKGFNELTIVGTDETGTSQTLNLVITFSTAKLELQSSLLQKLVKTAYAAEDEATDAGETVTDKIKERLQDTVSEGLVSIKEQLTAKSTAPRQKAYVGKINHLDEASLTLSYKEQEFNVNLTPKTIFVKGANTAIDWEDLTGGDFVIAMGWYDPVEEVFTAGRVSRIGQPEVPTPRQLISGKISEVDGQKVTVNGKSLTLSKKTNLTISGVTKPTAEDLALGDNLFAVVTLDGNGDIDAVNNVYVLPGKNNPAGLTPTNLNATNSGVASPSAENAQ